MHLSELLVAANILGSLAIAWGALRLVRNRMKTSPDSFLDGAKLYLAWLVVESLVRWFGFLISWDEGAEGVLLSLLLVALQMAVILGGMSWLMQRRQRAYTWEEATCLGIVYGATPVLGYNLLLLAAWFAGDLLPWSAAWISPIAAHCVSAMLNWFLVVCGLLGIAAAIAIQAFFCAAILHALQEKNRRWLALAGAYGIGAFAFQGFLYFSLDIPSSFDTFLSSGGGGSDMESSLARFCNALFSSLFGMAVLTNSLVFAGLGILGLRSLRRCWRKPESNAAAPPKQESQDPANSPELRPQTLQAESAAPKSKSTQEPKPKPKSKRNKGRKRKH